MKNKFIFILAILLLLALPTWSDEIFEETLEKPSDSFFLPSSTQAIDPIISQRKPRSTETVDNSKSIPPIKLLRLKLKEKSIERKNAKMAPVANDVYVGDVETSEYVSKEIKDDFDENMTPDGFESDEITANETSKASKGFFYSKEKNSKPKMTDEIILDCDNVDYDTPNYLINAKGHAVVNFVTQGTIVKADTIVYDRANNTITADGNVSIHKGSHIVTGDYIFIDMNEENGLIENPVTQDKTITIKSKKGYIYGDKIVQEDGNMEVDGSMPIHYNTAGESGPRIRRMLVPQDEEFTSEIEKGLVRVKARDIKINQKGDLETISFKKFNLLVKNKTILKVPAVKFYSNKKHEYVESNIWEVGSYRGLGVYTGPGFVFELPKGSVLKLMPTLNYESGIGIGALGRFSSGTNHTMAAYGTAKNKFLLNGVQKLDDNLTLEYGINDYMDEWFLGRRRPKYGAALVYKKSYSANNFLLQGRTSSFQHRMDAGYYHDLDFDGNFEKISGGQNRTARFRYMAQATQQLYSYQNVEKMTAFQFGLISQLSAAIYGSGETQVIGRLAPSIHTQYKRWMQDISYFFSAYDDNTPMRRFDAYRYGTQNLYIREYFRICRYLTLAWFGSICMSNDSPTGERINESTFYITVGPDDIKFSLGYDFIRQSLMCMVDLMLDAKGLDVDYEKLEIKQDKKAKDDNHKTTAYGAPTSQNNLEYAQVEDIRTAEDVL